MLVTLKLTSREQVETLIHCLNYGESAVSANDVKSGAADKRNQAIAEIRKQILNQAFVENNE